MKIIKGIKGKWGNFRILPSKNWRISQSFIDFESGLLIIRESPIDTSKYKRNKYGTVLIPSTTYVIDRSERRILPSEEWRKQFDYEPKETIVESDNVKLVETRIPSQGGNFDHIKSALIDLESGSIISQGSRVGFHEKKQKNVYENYKARKEEARRKRDKEQSQLTLEHFYFHEKSRIEYGQAILYYTHEGHCFRARMGNGYEVIIETGGEKPPPREKVNYWKRIDAFNSIDEFWSWLNQDEKWYYKYKPFWERPAQKVDNSVLAYFIIHEANRIRYTTELDKEAWSATRLWENAMNLNLLKKSEQIQVCPNCMSKVMFFPMFSTAICGNCSSQTTDEDGRRVSFSNVSMSGGCQGYYVDTREKYDYHYCYIGERKFYAKEMKFGGIAIVPFEDRNAR